MKILYLPLLFIFFMVPAMPVADPIDHIANLIRADKIHELAQMFASSIEITLHDDENVYTKTQAELVIDKFFNENKPRSVKMLHRVSSNPTYLFGVITVNTDKGVFRIACTLKQSAGGFELIEMRIEPEKMK